MTLNTIYWSVWYFAIHTEKTWYNIKLGNNILQELFEVFKKKFLFFSCLNKNFQLLTVNYFPGTLQVWDGSKYVSATWPCKYFQALCKHLLLYCLPRQQRYPKKHWFKRSCAYYIFSLQNRHVFMEEVEGTIHIYIKNIFWMTKLLIDTPQI